MEDRVSEEKTPLKVSARVEFKYDPYNDDVFLCGEGDSGKTHLLKHLIIPLYRGAAWVWYPEKREDNLPDYVKGLGWQVVRSVDELPYGRALLYPRDKSQETFDSFCRKANSHTNLTVIVDEAHMYTGKFKIRSKNYAKIINAGRPRGVCTVNIARRPQQISNDIIGNARHIFAFQMDLPSDIEFMEKWIGPEVERFQEPKLRRPQFRDLAQYPVIQEFGFVYRNTRTRYTAVGKI